MSNNKRWIDDDLPPPSMRQKYTHGLLRYFSPSTYSNHQMEEKDKILQQRLTNLNMDKFNKNQMETLSSLEERAKLLTMNDGSQDMPSVSDIEKRLSKLHDLPLEDIRYPRSAIVNANKIEEETVDKLMRRARDEAMLETKWDASRKSEDKHDIDPTEFIKMCKNNASVPDELNGELFISDTDLMGQDTIRNLKEIQRTMKLAKQRSVEAAKLTGISSNNHTMDNEIKKLMKLTNQSNLKSRKISDELSKFWDRRRDHEVLSSSESSFKSENSDDKSEISDDKSEIDCEELHKIVLEAEKAENEAMQLVKESKKNNKKSVIMCHIAH
uniref:Uncharacterized protein n=2 Tax=Wuchereria bancrofti TaxID=6293 RepID=A0A1I8EGN2_WUCBA